MNAGQNAFGTSSGTRSEQVPRAGARTSGAREPLLSYEQPTSSRIDAQRRGRADEQQEIARLNAIHPLDAMAATVAMLRPDWHIGAIRGVLGRTRASRIELAERVMLVALDPEQRTPLGIENGDLRRYKPEPMTYPTVAEALATTADDNLDEHGFPHGRCPVCRRGAA